MNCDFTQVIDELNQIQFCQLESFVESVTTNKQQAKSIQKWPAFRVRWLAAVAPRVYTETEENRENSVLDSRAASSVISIRNDVGGATNE